jgi:hypothetical protein
MKLDPVCTAPCEPPCQNLATFKLLNFRSRSFLGENCDLHLSTLLSKAYNGDYDKAPLDVPVEETPDATNP